MSPSLSAATLLFQSRLFQCGTILCKRSCIYATATAKLQRHQPPFLFHTSSILNRPADIVASPKRGVRESVCGFFDKRLGITFTENYRWKDLNVASHVLLNSIYMKVDFAAIQKHTELEDSFESWLKIVYIHIWMLLVKLKQHGRDGKLMSKSIVQVLWLDIDARAVKIQEELEQHLEIKKQMRDYYDLLHTSFLFFDEGLLKGDETLAGSLWKMVFGCEDVDPRQLECLVQYIRFTMARLDEIPLERLVLDAENVKWPLPEKFGSYD